MVWVCLNYTAYERAKCAATSSRFWYSWPPSLSPNWYHDKVRFHRIITITANSASLISAPAGGQYTYPNGTSGSTPTVTGSTSPHKTGGLSVNAHAQSYCCFVLQDTVTPVYWARMASLLSTDLSSSGLDEYTTTWYGMRLVTSLITSVTEYVDTTITNYETTTTIKNTTFLSSSQVAYDGIPTANSASYTPWTVDTMLNVTATEYAGHAV